MKKIFTLSMFILCLLLLPGTASGDTLVLKNGTRISGVLVSRTSSRISFRNSRGVVRSYKNSQVQKIETTSQSANTSNPSGSYGSSNSSTNNDRQPELLPAGTLLVVLTNESIDSKTAAPNQLFAAQVEQDVLDGSNELVVPKGSPAQLLIRKVAAGGITSGSEITLDIQSITVHGRRYGISTSGLTEKGRSGIGANKRTAEMVGGGALIGTIIGAIVGHGKGAAIGAAAGAAGGAGVQVLTKGKQVVIPAETVLKFNLNQSVTLSPEP